MAVALAWLGKEADLRHSFVDRRGLDVLLELLTDQRRDASLHKEAAGKGHQPLLACLSFQMQARWYQMYCCVGCSS